MTISTRVWSSQHPNADQNIQQPIVTVATVQNTRETGNINGAWHVLRKASATILLRQQHNVNITSRWPILGWGQFNNTLHVTILQHVDFFQLEEAEQNLDFPLNDDATTKTALSLSKRDNDIDGFRLRKRQSDMNQYRLRRRQSDGDIENEFQQNLRNRNLRFRFFNELQTFCNNFARP